MVSLWLVRHAQPLVAPGTCYGRLDVPADTHATLTAARALAEIDLAAAFARMMTAPREPGQHRWRVLAAELEAFLDASLKGMMP